MQSRLHLSEKPDIRKYSLEQLTNQLTEINEKAFRAKQIHEWLWKKNASDFSEMTNLSKPLRQWLQDNYSIPKLRVDFLQKSNDGTIKNAVKLSDNKVVESVLIPTESRSTACVSSQVGCSLDCNFCATAKLKRMRNLSAAEIVDQVVLIDKQSQSYFDRPLSNIVFMGMGEPLLNYIELVKSIEQITSPKGLGMSPRRITVSTSGIPKMIEKLADENLRVNLALSLHSAIEEKRNQIMPFSVKFPLTELLKSLQYWYNQTKKRITLEYIVWKSINDSLEDVEALVLFAKKVPTKINLIEYNTVDDSDEFSQAESKSIDLYINTLERNGLIVNVRRSRGQDIDAACGQLANKEGLKLD